MRRASALSLLLAPVVAGAAVSTRSRDLTALLAAEEASKAKQHESSNCISISPAANDFWCATNCGSGGHCPATICKCGQGVGSGNVTSEEMDYLKSSSLNAEKYSKEVQCLSMEDVAKIWVSAIAPISSTNAIAMCVPAVVIAAGNVFDVPQNKCPGSFHPTLKVDGGEFLHKGLWQITKGFDADPEKQAVAVHNIYTSNDAQYGCLSSQCQATDCHVPIDGIGQDESIISHHRFCRGKWAQGEQYIRDERLEAVGGLQAVKAACSTMAAKAGLKETVKKMSVSPVIAPRRRPRRYRRKSTFLSS
jgi:hypothetical protein